MSLFQCERCGCAENTALSGQGIKGFPEQWYDWTGIEDRKGLLLCSACGPTRYADDPDPTGFGKWHGKFERVFLPKGMFFTNRVGNLEHKETGSEDFKQYRIDPEVA